jgi:hypothetical protein
MKRIPVFVAGTILVGTLAIADSDARRPTRLLNSTPDSGLAAAPTPAPTPALTGECADGIEGIDDCPVAGCGELGDSLLNAAKNRTDVPAHPTKMTLDDVRAIPEPQRWNTGSNRSSIKGPGKEGTGVVVTGFLLKVKPEGGESCNCGLTRRVDTDVHLALVDPEEGEEESVTAEITPRVRANGHPDWVFKNVNDHEGEYVRVTGWLMLDTKHIPQSHRLLHERPNHNLKRATNWEVHPVTKMEVCTKSKKACDKNRGWEEF